MSDGDSTVPDRTPRRRAVGYARVSTTDQAREGISLDMQREKIRQYCELKDLDLMEIIDDASVSGGKPLQERPGGRRVWSLAIDGGCDIVAFKLDRMFRNALDCLTVTEACKDAGVGLHLMDVMVDTSTPYGRMFMLLVAAFAELELGIISQRTKDALAQLKADGKRVGRPMYGWTVDEDSYLIEVPSQQTVIHDIVTMRNNGAVYEDIADALNARGERTQNGKRWRPTQLMRIVQRWKDGEPNTPRSN